VWQARRLVMHMCRCQVQVGIAFPRPFGLTVAWHRGVDHGWLARELEREGEGLTCSAHPRIDAAVRSSHTDTSRVVVVKCDFHLGLDRVR
jgi:hypothetical protein